MLFSPDEAQEWEFRSGQLDCFMSACIVYCETTGHHDILIEFA